MSNEYATKVQDVLARAFGGAPKPKEAGSLEELAAGLQPVTNLEAGAEKLTDTIPIPKDGMSLPDMHDLYTAYTRVLEAGALISRFTDFAANTTKTNDPIEVGKARMTHKELRGYNWWQFNATKDEFDWDNCVERTPTHQPNPDKDDLLTQALQRMYEDPSLTLNNMLWIRKNKIEHYHIVYAYYKIIKAAHDIVSGLVDADPVIFKEYQAISKIVGTVDNNINEFMRGIHEILRPLEGMKEELQGRKKWCQKKLGMKVAKEGALARRGREMGFVPSIGVSKPLEAPRGARVARTETTTIAELMENRKKRKADRAATTTISSVLPFKKGKFEAREASPEYRPRSPSPVPRGSARDRLSSAHVENLASALRLRTFGSETTTLFTQAPYSTHDTDLIGRTHAEEKKSGETVLHFRSPRSNKLKVLEMIWNGAFKRGWARKEDYDLWVLMGAPEDFISKTALLCSEVHTRAAISELRKGKGAEENVQMGGAGPS